MQKPMNHDADAHVDRTNARRTGDGALKFAVDAFHEAQSDIRVSFQKLAWDDVHQKLLTSLAADSGAPDVSAVDFEYLGGFSSRGGFVDLSQKPYDAGQFQADIVDFKWNQSLSADGRLVAFPWDIGPGGLWYRADLFEAVGLETDPDKVQAQVKSWDDWFRLGEELRAAGGPALIADSFSDVFYPAVLQQPGGQGWFDGDRIVVEEKAVRALELALEAQERQVTADIGWWSPEWNAGVKNDAFAGMGVASWEQIYLQADNPQTAGAWRVMHAPEGDYNWGGGFMAIPEQSEKKDAAWEFIKFVCATKEGQNALFLNSGIFPAYKPAWDDPFYDEPVEFFGGQKVNRLWTEIAQGAPGASVHPAFREANEIVDAEVAKVKNEGKDPSAAMRDAEAAIAERIDGVTP